MIGVYDLDLVLLSMAVAVLASYVALDLASRVTASTGRTARYWLVAGAVSMGMGIWAMHFIAMLAFQLPIPASYSVPITALSLLIAMVASGFALHTVSRARLGLRRLLGGGVLIGIGIAAMHYTGMAAMQMIAPVRYDPWLFALSIVVAVVASLAALWLAFQLRGESLLSGVWRKSGSALLMGLAICGMHYTGMAAAIFAPHSMPLASDPGMDSGRLAVAIGVFTVMLLTATLLVSLLDARRVRDHGRVVELARNAAVLAGIAHHERVEAALQASTEQARALVETASDPYIVIDAVSRILEWNRQAEHAFGWSREQVLGRDLTEIVIPSQHREAHRRGMQHFLATGEGPLLSRRIEITALHRAGHEFAVELTIWPTRVGASWKFNGFVHDISERKDAEKHLLQMEGRYRGLLEAAPDAMVVVNQSGDIVLLNAQAEKQFGYRRDELVGQQVKNIIPEGFAERLIADATRTAADALAQQIGTGIELSGRRKDGTEFPIEIMLSPLQSTEGILVTAAIRNISKRKLAEADLEQRAADLARSNTELEQFAYIASHDLQEPLRMVSSYTQLLAKRYQGKLDADADEFIAYAVQGVLRMHGLIQALLAYSRAGNETVNITSVVCEAILARTLSNLAPAIEEAGAEVTHDPLPVVVADELQLGQVLQNLIGNALKYRDAEPPRIHVTAAKREREWLLSVRDNGIGIAPEYAERIFVIFKRLHQDNAYPRGAGIGLTICKKIVERHGGRIWVEPAAGSGSIFYFTLPDRQLKESP